MYYKGFDVVGRQVSVKMSAVGWLLFQPTPHTGFFRLESLFGLGGGSGWLVTPFKPNFHLFFSPYIDYYQSKVGLSKVAQRALKLTSSLSKWRRCQRMNSLEFTSHVNHQKFFQRKLKTARMASHRLICIEQARETFITFGQREKEREGYYWGDFC